MTIFSSFMFIHGQYSGERLLDHWSSGKFLVHLSQRLTCELIVSPISGVGHRRCCCRPFSNIFSTETAWPIKAKFHVKTHWDGGTKVCKIGPGHMTKMAAMPIYGKNL